MNTEETMRMNLGWVASTDQGRHFLWDILSFCGVYQDIAGETPEVNRALGRRQVGLHLLALLSDTEEELIFKMMREAKEREILREIKDERTNEQRDNRDNQPSDSIEWFFGSGEHRSEPDNELGAGYSTGGAIF